MSFRDHSLGSSAFCTLVRARSRLYFLPAYAPVPSTTDKYCPNPELSLYTESAEVCGRGQVLSLAVGLDQWLQATPKH